MSTEYLTHSGMECYRISNARQNKKFSGCLSDWNWWLKNVAKIRRYLETGFWDVLWVHFWVHLVCVEEYTFFVKRLNLGDEAFFVSTFFSFFRAQRSMSFQFFYKANLFIIRIKAVNGGNRKFWIRPLLVYLHGCKAINEHDKVGCKHLFGL